MVTWFKTLEQAVESWDPSSVDAVVSSAAAEREAFCQRFPRADWSTMPVETYALGVGGEPVSYWLEYKTKSVGPLPAHNASTHLIYKDKDGDWRWPKGWSSLDEAWSAVRAGVVEALALAEAGDNAAIDALGAFQASRTPLHKTLHLYFPERFLPISATSHLQHFARRLLRSDWNAGTHGKMGHCQLGALLMGLLRRHEILRDASTDLLMQFLYGWCDPQTSPQVLKVAPGEGARYGDDCLRGGYIRIGWEKIGDLSTALSGTYSRFKASFVEEFRDLYNGHKGTLTRKSKELWTLCTAEPGTVILANDGIQRIVGVGRVREPGYRWIPGLDEFNHSVSVDWIPGLAGEIPRQGAWATVTVQEIEPEAQDSLLGPLLGAARPPRPSWIFQCNPKHYDLETALANETELSWGARQHVADMGPGDTVYLWRSGSQAGVVAVCTIVAGPDYGAWPPDPYDLEGEVPDSAPWVRLRIDTRLDTPISKAAIIAADGLGDLTILKMPQGTNYALTEVQAERLAALVRASVAEGPDAPEPDPAPPTFAEVAEAVRSAGLHVTDVTLANYLLALQTRRFVLLTGISGTGKTKLAQTVAQQFPVYRDQLALPADASPDVATVTVQPACLAHRRFFLPAALATRFPALADKQGSGKVLVHFPGGAETLTTWNGTAVQVLLKGKARAWFEETFEVGDPLLIGLTDMRDDQPTALRIERPRVARRRDRVDNVAVVAVRPDWTDNRGLLGYLNPLTSDYMVTKFLSLVLDAQDEVARAATENRAPRAFFAILDEMNLARVEHYFSDFLSSMESGAPIELHHDLAVALGEREGRPVPMQVSIPPNLFIVGTVNVDETTYMFSPKVLDRAFTLELNEVHLDGPPAEADATPLRLDRWDRALRYEAGAGTQDWELLGSDAVGQAARGRIARVHRILTDHGRPFGYRVAYEMARFVRLAREQASHERAADVALDLAILQKVLPKLAGTRQELEPALNALLAEALEGESTDPARWELRGTSWESDKKPAVPHLPRTAARLWTLRARLRTHGFGAFVE